MSAVNPWDNETLGEGWCSFPYILIRHFHTTLGSSLSPPVFSCHGDDVKLRHRFSPVDDIRGGAAKAEQSRLVGAVILYLSLPVICLLLAEILASICKKKKKECGKLCIYRPVNAETRSEPRYFFTIYCFFLRSVLHFFLQAFNVRREPPNLHSRSFQNKPMQRLRCSFVQ